MQNKILIIVCCFGINSLGTPAQSTDLTDLLKQTEGDYKRGQIKGKRLEKESASRAAARRKNAKKKLYSGNNITTPSTSSGSKKTTSLKGIKNIERKGRYTIIFCSDGRKRKVHHNSYGKCEMPSTFGSYPCDYAIKTTKKSCF